MRCANQTSPTKQALKSTSGSTEGMRCPCISLPAHDQQGAHGGVYTHTRRLCLFQYTMYLQSGALHNFNAAMHITLTLHL